MQIEVPLQDSQGKSADVVLAPPGPCFATQDEALTQIMELEKKHHDRIVTFVERSKQDLALLKQSNQLLARAESAEAKSAEEQEEKDHLAAIAVLQEQFDSLKEKNKELLASLKERVQAEATIKEQLTNSKNLHEHIQHQLDQALQRETILKDQLESERKMCQVAGSQLVADRQRVRDLSTRLENSIAEKEEIKVAATSILQVVSGLSENEVSKHFLERVPGLIQVYCKKAARSFASRALGSVRAFFPSLDLTPVGEGVPEDCSTEDLAGHIAAMESVAERLLSLQSK